MELNDKDIQVMDVGTRLKELRQERNKSMRALARDSGLSTNALSMIERGRTSPSVSTLYKLADALEVPITAFFRVQPPRQAIVFRKAGERSSVDFPRGRWEGLGGEAFLGRVEPFMLHLEPGATSGPHGLLHSGHEFVMLIEGSLEYEVEGQRFVFEPGDTLLFASRLHHRWRNPGKTPAHVLFVLSGFELDERPSEFHRALGKVEEDSAES